MSFVRQGRVWTKRIKERLVKEQASTEIRTDKSQPWGAACMESFCECCVGDGRYDEAFHTWQKGESHGKKMS